MVCSLEALKMSLKKSLSTLTNVIGIAGLILAGYVLIISAPDFKRYMKISTM
jgi:hypothetical protein